MPGAVCALARQERGCESFARGTCALAGHDRAVGVGQVAKRLPADRGITVEGPVDYVHTGDIMAGFGACRSRARLFVARSTRPIRRDPMRKLMVHEFLSLDGVLQAPGGTAEDRDGGFTHGGWTQT